MGLSLRMERVSPWMDSWINGPSGSGLLSGTFEPCCPVMPSTPTDMCYLHREVCRCLNKSCDLVLKPQW